MDHKPDLQTLSARYSGYNFKICHGFLFLKSLHFVFLLVKLKYWLNDDNNEKNNNDLFES